MKVKAKWSIKVDGVWHRAGEVFDVKSTDGLLNAVDVLEAEPKPAQVTTDEAASEEAPKAKPEAEERPKTRTRKKVTQ